jgi:tetratricopeptide (TPR) repeat protein
LALGQYYYTVDGEYDRAMDYLDRARDGGYRDPELYHLMGAVLRRMPGRLDEAVSSFEEAVRLDPVSGHIADDLGSTLLYANRFDEAERILDRAIALNPNDWSPYRYRARVFLAVDGADTRRARAAVAEAPDTTVRNLGRLRWRMDLLDRDFDGALARLETRGAQGSRLATTLMLVGRTDEARVVWENEIEQLETRLAENPEFGPLAFNMLGFAEAYAGAGRDEDAIRSVYEMLQADPIAEDALNGSLNVLWAATILASMEQVDAAVDALKTVAASPMGTTWASVSANPAWDPIRDDPKFQALAGEFSNPR